MTHLNNGDSSIVEIGNNHIRYHNEVLKISNISRTWIFRFQNVEREKFEEEKAAYERAKVAHESREQRKNKAKARNFIIVSVFLLILSIIAFSFKQIAVGFLLLCAVGFMLFMAYLASKKTIEYPQSSPVERPFPDKFGLAIEMNSRYTAVFTAIGDSGVKALKQLQDDIEAADKNKEPIIFNLNDNSITVENKDGIINTGDNASNIFSRDGIVNTGNIANNNFNRDGIINNGSNSNNNLIKEGV